MSRERTFRAMDAGIKPCALATDGVAYCWELGMRFLHFVIDSSGPRPVARDTVLELRGPTLADRVPGGQAFVEIGASARMFCGLTADSSAWCAGKPAVVGAPAPSAIPRPAATWSPRALGGGLKFASIRVGGEHACGLTTSGTAYCWGHDGAGALGYEGPGRQMCWGDMGERIPCRTRPVPVQGAPAFASLSAGGSHTCGLTADSAAWCWGSDLAGQLGRGAQSFGTGERLAFSSRPAPVVGGVRFAAISAGMAHTCGLTVAGLVYCWGIDLAQGPERCVSVRDGGDGWRPFACSTRPLPVAGGMAFRSIASGDTHTCALTQDGAAYCGGTNFSGELGDGTRDERTAPTRVAGPVRNAGP
jgi:hypothetical protein